MKTYINLFNHVSLSVPALGKALPLYQKLLSALGFTRTFDTPATAGFAGSANPVPSPNDHVVGFWQDNPAEVERIAQLIGEGGRRTNAGPHIFPISPSYYAAFFEDPSGDKFERMHRRL